MASDPDLTGIPVDTSTPVLVTGATGYVAGWIVKGLLDAGVTVHAAVRDPTNTGKVQHLLDLAAHSSGDVRLFAADLLKDGSYTEAMQGCGIVLHTASPFTTRVKDPQRELVDPAVQGTRTVLESANAVESVKRVVLTSSCAAIYSDAADCAEAPGGRLTEDVWNTTASLTTSRTAGPRRSRSRRPGGSRTPSSDGGWWRSTRAWSSARPSTTIRPPRPSTTSSSWRRHDALRCSAHRPRRGGRP